MNPPEKYGLSPVDLLAKGLSHIKEGRPFRARYFLAECLKEGGRAASEAKAALSALEKSLLPSGKAPGISLCMIVRNEEACLAKCLASADPYVDEIIIVDTGSSDKTVDIARSFGARVSTFTWIDDFSAARNASLDLASCKWVLWLDADDVVPPNQGEAVRRIKAGAAACGFFAHVASLVENAENPEYLQLRFFPNLPQLRFEQRIHEQVAPSLARLGLKTIDSGFRITHTGYIDMAKRAEKARRNIDLLREELKQNRTLALFCALGDSLYVCEEYRAAMQAYGDAIQMGSSVESDRSLFLQAHVSLALSLSKAGLPDEALAILERLLKLEPDKADALFLAADLLFKADQVDQAQNYLLRVVNAVERIGAAGVDYAKLKRNALLRLVSCLLDHGEWEKALEFGRMGMARYPNVADFWISTAEALLSLRKIEESLALYEQSVRACPDTAGKAYAGKAGCLIAQNKISEAMAVLEEGAIRTPTEPRIFELMGDLFFSQNKPQPSLVHYVRAIECGTPDAKLFLKAASCSADLKNYAESLAFIERLLTIDPQNSAAQSSAEQLRKLLGVQKA